MPFCPNCGREAQNDTNFCPTCGADLSAAPVTPPPLGTPQELPYYISLKRVILMMVLTWGMYLFYWFYLTWKQYRDHTGDEAYPVWHALTQFVPIYDLFRTHAHARTFRALMWDAGISSNIRPGWAWVIMLISRFCEQTGILIPIAIALYAVLCVHLQSNINRYWQGMNNGRVLSARIGVGEVIFGIIGALGWLSLVIILSPWL